MIEIKHGFFQTKKYSVRVAEWGNAAANEIDILVPPYWDEMHSCRQFLRKLGSALAERGRRSILFDPPGMGETQPLRHCELADQAEVLKELIRFVDPERVRLISFRSGYLMVKALGEQVVGEHLSCSPITQGAAMIRGLIRQKVISLRLGGNDSLSANDLMQQLENGSSIEVGGNLVTSTFYAELSNLDESADNLVARRKLSLGDVNVPEYDMLDIAVPKFWGSTSNAEEETAVNDICSI